MPTAASRCSKVKVELFQKYRSDCCKKLLESGNYHIPHVLCYTCNYMSEASHKDCIYCITNCLFCCLSLRSVVMSIQLLPKLFSSFQQFVATGHGPHWVTAWASRELNMMELFFNNITQFVESLRRGDAISNSPYSPVEEVQARLQYLSSVFSCELSQQDFSKFVVVCMA